MDRSCLATTIATSCGLVILLSSLVGCRPPSETSGPTSSPSRELAVRPEVAQSLAEETVSTSEDDDSELLEERWYALYYGVDDVNTPDRPASVARSPQADGSAASPGESFGGDPLFRTSRKIGHMQIRVATQPWGKHQLVRTDMLQHVSMQRYQQEVTQQILLSSLETESGEVLRMRSELNDGGESMTTNVQCQADSLRLTVRTLGQEESLQLPWQTDWRGFFAEHQTLRRRPLSPGETRERKTFVPVLNVVGDLRLTGTDFEWIETPFGSERLLRIESELVTPQITLESTLWMDDEGTVRKYVVRQGSMTAYQTLKAVALAPNDEVDLYEAIQIRVVEAIPQPHSKHRAVYRLKLKSGRDPAEFFFTGPAQQLEALGPGLAKLTVRAIRPDIPQRVGEPEKPPVEADLAANNLIQTEDALVRELAAEVFPVSAEASQPDDWQWALACEQFVHRMIERKVLTEAFRSAAEVARTRQGDCTEHAVLLAALCRVHGIPARVVTGLVAVGDLYGFHMWNEVWIQDRWIPLDATLARGGIGAGHLKLSDSNLEGVSPFSALAPVLQILGDVELEVVTYE
jgi:transglutaminase-like putative cysteine protease